MIKSLKKAFTIIELVIVIAVIAILAAVMIPTYSSLVDKANLSADEQAVKQMNTALAIYTAENGKPSNGGEVKLGLYENDINVDTMEPVTQGYAFYWNPTDNKIVLVGEGKAKAESDWVLLTSTGYGTLKELSSATEINSLIENSSVNDPVLIKLKDDIDVSSVDFTTINIGTIGNVPAKYVVGNGKSVIIDLNEKTLKETICKYATFCVLKGGTLTIKNGTIEGLRRVIGNFEGTVVLSHVTIKEITEDGGVIYCHGISDTTINDCHITSSVGNIIGTNSSSDEADGARISITNSTIETTGALKDDTNDTAINITINAKLSIDACTISGFSQGIYLRGCSATISNSTITHNSNATGKKWGSGNDGPAADIVFACGGTSIMTGYITIGNYNCSNVTASSVVVHNPNGEGNITISGIENYHYCTRKGGEICDGNH